LADIPLGTLVRCFWLDAHGSAANVAYSIDEIPHAAVEVVSHGILLKDDEVGVSIASEVCDKDIYRGYSFVPRLMVVRVEAVKRPRRRRTPPAPVTPPTP